MSSAITDSFIEDHHLVQQHHDREAGLPYPMADGALPTRGAAIADRVAALSAGD